MMKFFAVPLTLYLVLGVGTKADGVQQTPSACGEIDKEDTSEVNLFFKNVQCTLEKAKPWVDEIEKEAKKLEETAKKIGEGVISRLSDLMEKWIAGDNITSSLTSATDIQESASEPVKINEVGVDVPEKCAAGQVLDVEGKCQRVV